MWFWPKNSTILIFSFFVALALINIKSLSIHQEHDWGSNKKSKLEKIPTIIKGLSYFNLKRQQPVLSLTAQEMESVDNDFASFVRPHGSYFRNDQKDPINYQAENAEYDAKKQVLELLRQAKMDFGKSHYEADKITYMMKDNIVIGLGDVVVDAYLEKTKEKVHLESGWMKAWPEIKKSIFNPRVTGHLESLKKTNPTIFFESNELTLNSLESHIELLENVKMKKGEVNLSSRKADIFMENQNKKLKYFVLSDDVKMVEKFIAKNGEPIERRAFGQRIEGFGYDGSIHLSGAPRVEQGRDLLKGYKIILREKLEFIEVEDAMSDVETKKSKKEKKQ